MTAVWPEQTVAEVTVGAADRAALRTVVDELADTYRTVDSSALLRRARTLGNRLPDNVRAALRDMRYLEASAALAVRGGVLDTAGLGPTPGHWRTGDRRACVRHDVWLLLLVAQLGDPVGWASLQDGRLVADVLPIEGEETEQTGHGSVAELEFHVEDAFHDNRCDALGLICLRGGEAAPTTVAAIDAVDRTAWDADPLFEPRFEIRPDTEHLRHHRGPVPSEPRAVLFGDRASPYLRVDPSYCAALPGDVAARTALDTLHQALRAALVEVELAPGDVLVIDNLRAVHGRRRYQPSYDGTDRWLRKLTVLRDLRQARRYRAGPGGRIMVPFRVGAGADSPTGHH